MKLIAWLFAFLILTIGIINLFWGNDPGYGVFLVLVSLLYFPPFDRLLLKKTGIAIPRWIKILLAFFIFWTALGVAELFDKINLMLNDFS